MPRTPKKYQNPVTFRPNPENQIILRELGLLNAHGRVKKRPTMSLSAFLNQAIKTHVRSLTGRQGPLYADHDLQMLQFRARAAAIAESEEKARIDKEQLTIELDEYRARSARIEAAEALKRP